MAQPNRHGIKNSSLVAFYEPLISKQFPAPYLSAPTRKSELQFENTSVSDDVASEAAALLAKVNKRTRARNSDQGHPCDPGSWTKLQQAILGKDSSAFEPLLVEPDSSYEQTEQLSLQASQPVEDPSPQGHENGKPDEITKSKERASSKETANGSSRRRASHAQNSNPNEPKECGPVLPIPAGKRRRTASTGYLRTTEADTQAALETLKLEVEGFINISKQTARDAENEEEDEVLVTPSKHARKLQHLTLSLSQLHPHLHKLPGTLTTDFLAALLPLIVNGKEIELRENDDMDSDSLREACVCLDASSAALTVMSAPDMPVQVLNEAVMLPTCEAIKHHLLSNVLSKFSPRIRGCLAQGVENGSKQETKRRKSAKVDQMVVRGLPDVLGSRLEQALKCLGDLLEAAHIDGTLVLPIVRIAAETLTLEDMGLLQLASIDFLAAAFKRYDSQQDVMFADIFNTILPNMSVRNSSKGSTGHDSAELQPVTLLFLELAQESAGLPDLDTCPDTWSTAAFMPSVRLADSFWRLCFERLPSSKALKADKDLDFKALVETLVSDVWAAVHKPEYPVATVTLMRFQSMLGSSQGLHHHDSHVRQICIDLLNTFGRYLFSLSQTEDSLVEKWRVTYVSHVDIPLHTQRLLDFLMDSELDQKTCRAARKYILSQNFAQKAGGGGEKVTEKSEECKNSLTAHWHAIDTTFDSEGLSREEAAELAVASDLRRLKTARLQSLKWLQDMLDSKDNGPAIRAKAIKALSEWAQQDATLLSRPQISACFQKALSDDSSSVRQESLNFLGAHIKKSKELAVTYFDILAALLNDPSVAVRKTALKIIWEACVLAQGSPKTVDACHIILQRAAETEDASQNVAVKFVHSLWFSPTTEAGVEQDCASRAMQLAAVAFAMKSEELKPMEPTSPLVCFLTKALELEEKTDPSLTNVHDLAAAMLESFISALETNEHQSLQYLLALNALALSNPALCVPSGNRTSFLIRLAPYLKTSGNLPDDKRRLEAETLICLLSILSIVLKQLKGTTMPIMLTMDDDLVSLIKRHSYTAVVSSACQTMQSLLSIDRRVGQQITYLAATILAKIKENRSLEFPQKHHVIRFLSVLGRILQYCADTVEKVANSPDYQGTEVSCNASFQECLEIVLLHPVDPRIQEFAFKCMGQIGIVRPTLLMHEKIRGLISQAMKDSRNFALKRAALGILLDLLTADATKLGQAQKAKEKGKKKKDTKKGKENKSPTNVPSQNGEQDDLFVGSSLLQENMCHVRRLALEVSASPCESPGHKPCEETRNLALQILEAVERNGIMPPWELIPTLVALVTDPSRAFPNSNLALRLLKHIASQHAEYMSRHIGEGLTAASKFQACLVGTHSTKTPRPSLPAMPSALSGFVRLYLEVMHTQRCLRVSFLTALIRPHCERACDLETVKAKPVSLVQFSAQVAAALPLKKVYEVFALLHSIHAIVGQHGSTAVSGLKSSMQAESGTKLSKDRAVDSCMALITLLMLSNTLMSKYGMKPDRLALLETSAERRKADENKDVQISEESQLPMDKILALVPQEGAKYQEIYETAKFLMHNFHTTHVGVPTSDAGAAAAEHLVPSPEGKETPKWAKEHTELARVSSAKANGLNRLNSTGSRQRRDQAQRRKSNLSRTAPNKRKKKESSESEEEDDPEAQYRPTKATRSRRRLESDL